MIRFNRKNNRFSQFFFIFFIVFFSSPSWTQQIEEHTNTEENTMEKTPFNPVRSGGSEWARNLITELLTDYEFQLNESYSGLEDCTDVLKDLKALKFQFVEPDYVTDDWDDSYLDEFKERYPRFKYGMGYAGLNSSPKFANIPTWNIQLYFLNVDTDDEMETLFSGERLVPEYYGYKNYTNSYIPNLPGTFSLGHLVFDLGLNYVKWGGGISDPMKEPRYRNGVLQPNSLILWNGEYLLLTTFFGPDIPGGSARIDFMSRQTPRESGSRPPYSGQVCKLKILEK